MELESPQDAASLEASRNQDLEDTTENQPDSTILRKAGQPADGGAAPPSGDKSQIKDSEVIGSAPTDQHRDDAVATPERAKEATVIDFPGTETSGNETSADSSVGAGPDRDTGADPCDEDGYRSPCSADPNKPPLLPISKIAIGELDVYGNSIVQVFNKRPCYAIYLARDKSNRDGVHVHLSDNESRANEQIDRLIDLNCLRAKLEYLTTGLAARNYYNKQTAIALQAALERKSRDQAKEHLQLLVKNATEERACFGRQFYMMSAGGVAAALALILIGVGSNLTGGAQQTGMLLLSSGAGALGAVLSIFIALRNRTVAPDQDWQTNIIDGAARIGIGVISAFALHLLLTSGFLTNAIAGGFTLSENGAGTTGVLSNLGWKSALLVGFAGGFLERMVPDLLEKSRPPVGPSEKAKTTDPL